MKALALMGASFVWGVVARSSLVLGGLLAGSVTGFVGEVLIDRLRARRSRGANDAGISALQ